MTADQLDLLAIANNPQPWAAMQRERIIDAISALRAQGVLAFDHWGTNDDTAGGNAGKPQRVWRWTGGDL